MTTIKVVDHAHVQPYGEGWGDMTLAWDHGVLVQVSPAVYDNYLDMLPPVHQFVDGYIFAEGSGAATLFWRRRDGACFLQLCTNASEGVRLAATLRSRPLHAWPASAAAEPHPVG